MQPQQPQLQPQPQQQLRRFTDLLEALRHEYEGALAASASAAALATHSLPDPQYLNELALMQKTVKELEQAHVKAKQGFEEEVGRLEAVCKQFDVDVGQVATAASIMASVLPVMPNLEAELTAGVLTSSFSGEPRRTVTPPAAVSGLPAHPTQPPHQQAPQPHTQPQPPADKKQSGWMAIYALPEQQRAVAVDLLQTIASEHVVCSVSFSHDSRLLAVGSNRAVYIFDVQSGKRVAVLLDQGVEATGRDAADLYMRSVQWSDDDQLVAAGAEDHYVRVWTLQSQRLKHRLAGHTQDVYAVAFLASPSRLLASASGDRTVRLWDVQTGECRCQLTVNDHAGPNRDIGFTSLAVSDRLVVAGSLDKTVRVWTNGAPNQLDYQLACTLEGHQDAVYSVALSADHRTIASSSLDRTVRLWRQPPATDSIIFAPQDTLAHHKDFCLSVCLSADGKVLASASKDRSVLLYTVDQETGKAQLQCSVQGHRNSVIACQFANAAGNESSLLLASGSGDCRARIWRVDLL